MKKLFLIIVVFLISMNSFGQSKTSYADSVRRAYEEYARQQREDYDNYRNRVLKEYDEYAKAVRAEFEAYKKSISQIWGREEVQTSTETTWVEYSDDLESRSIVDFREGKVTVEVAMERRDFKDSTIVNELMTEAVAEVLESKGSTCQYPSEVEVAMPVASGPILEGLVDMDPYSIPESGKEAESSVQEPSVESGADTRIVAEAITTQTGKTVTETVGEDGKDRVLVQLEFGLVADNLSIAALGYKDLVDEFSARFRVEQPLIYAVIEQESAFNPQAISPAQACGLMQLVPKSGGRHAYNYVYGRDWIPTQSYLMVPRNNIELGTAYLRILLDMFEDVSNPDCRRLCVIAGYNTGAGNVSKSFTGGINVDKAVPYINKYDYKQLYRHLTTKLNSSEARNYVSGVTSIRENYLP